MEAVIFDLDGVLIDSMWVWNDLAYNYLKSLGKDPKKSLREDLTELSLYEGYEYLKIEYKLDKTVDEIEKGLNETLIFHYENKIELKPNVINTLKYLKDKGYKLVVGTATERVLAEKVLKKHNINKYFEFIETEVNYKKNDERFYLNICKKLNVSNINTCLIDDSLYALETGKAAGLKIFPVYDELSTKISGDIRKVEDGFIKDLIELKEVL